MARDRIELPTRGFSVVFLSYSRNTQEQLPNTIRERTSCCSVPDLCCFAVVWPQNGHSRATRVFSYDSNDIQISGLHQLRSS